VNEQEFKTRFPNASKSCVEVNLPAVPVLSEPPKTKWISGGEARESTKSMKSGEIPGLPDSRGGRQNSKRGMNQTEREYSLILQAAYPDQIIRFEEIKLRISDGCWYTPDFFLFVDGCPTFFEVKGAHVWDDSRVKFKAARELHKWANLELHQKKAGIWSQIY
jgi:hypothetical protein